MKKLLTSLALVTIVGSTQLIAANIDDGFNWPDGFSTDATSQQIQAEKTSGFNWPEGRSFDSDIDTSSHEDVADGMNWPAGF
ncbi:MAG: hypothetical protein GY744_05990 [Gammaproteobacteria bacterium]|nr:hypothetical protein [Gammaproteobacteria bacterium]